MTNLLKTSEKHTSSLSLLRKLFLIFSVVTSGTTLSLLFHWPMYILTFIYIMLLFTGEVKITIDECFIFFLIIPGCIWFGQTLLMDSEGLSLDITFKIFLMLFMFVTFCNSKKEMLVENFTFVINCILIFSIISNILFVFIIIGIPLPTMDLSFIPGMRGFLSVLYLEQICKSTFFGVLGYRNSGIFWEPGLYQIFLNLLVVYYLYCENKDWKNKWIILYLVLAIVTTGSMTGYALCAVEFALYVIFNSNRIVVKILMGVIFAVALIFLYPLLSRMLEYKMTVGASFETRFSDLVDSWDFIKKRLFWGYGPNTTEFAYYYRLVYGFFRGNTNGLISIFIQFGLIGFFAYAISLYNFCKFGVDAIGKKSFIPLLVWIVISFNNEPITTHTMVFFFMSLGICFIDFSQLRKKEMVKNHG